jgi:lysophospholipase L1-like esterase
VVSAPRPARPLRRRLAFVAILAALGLFVLLLAEAGTRLFVAPLGDDPFLGMTPAASIFTETEVDGVRVYKITHPQAYAEANTMFPVHKPPGALRVFCLGGSASAGWPHKQGENYASYLQHALAAAYPQRRFEVINASAHAFASYRIRMIFDDVVRLAPDLVVVWCGNNEFIEKRSYVVDSALARFARQAEKRSRLLQLVNGTLRRWLHPDNVLSGAGRQDADFHLWTHTEQVALQLRDDPAQFDEVCRHYEYSLRHVADECARRQVPLFLLTVPSNLRDWQPHVSKQSLPEAERAAWETDFRAARRLQLEGEHAEAVVAFGRLLAREPEHAAAHWHRAQSYELQGDRVAAWVHYLAAKDHDRNPFRALSRTNQIVRALCAQYPRPALVDAEAACRDAAAGPAPGFDLFLDYVHPTRAGNLVIARAVFQQVLARDPFRLPPATREFRDPPPYDEQRDLGVQITLLGLFSIMHQYEAFLRKADSVLVLFGELHVPLPPERKELVARCRAEFANYLQNERDEILGRPFDPAFRDRHRAFYREFFGQIATLKK